MQTINQLCLAEPKAAAATENLRFNKKLRRAVIESLVKLAPSTSPRDLASKVVQELSTDKQLRFLFSEEVIKGMDKQSLVYSKLDNAISLSANAYTGLIAKSTFEAEFFWSKASKSAKIKYLAFNTDVHLLGKEDKFRVYVTNPKTEVCILKNVQPFAFLDGDVKDRQRLQTVRDITFIKLSNEKALMLFNSINDGIQRRFEIPVDRLHGCVFKTIAENFIQDGLSIVERDLSGHEFDVNQFGDLVGEKRYGITPSVWVFDQTNRGRRGDQGPKGVKGTNGKDFFIRNATLHEHQMKALAFGKKIPTSRKELHEAFNGSQQYYVPFSKAFFEEIKRIEKD
jgi:hypothetical protein